MMNREDRGELRSRLVDAALAGESLLIFLYAWVYYPIADGHRGDFLAALSHRDNPSGFWNGDGLGYGPVFALYDLLLRPMRDLPAMQLMFVLNHILLALTFVVLVREFLPRPRTRRELLIAVFLWVNFYPLAQLIRQNNVEITELAFLAGFLAFLHRGRELTSGTFLGLAIGTKLVPIVLLPYMIWRRHFRLAAAALVTLAGLCVLVAVLKQHDVLSMLAGWGSAGTKAWSNEWNNNQALSGFFWRMFAEKDFSSEMALAYPKVRDSASAALATMGTSVIVALTIIVCFIGRSGLFPRGNLSVEQVEIQIVMLGALFVLPHSHTHYFGLIIPVYIIALAHLHRSTRASLQTGSLLFGGYLCLGFLMPLRFLDPIAHRYFPASLVEIAKLYSVPFLGAVLTFVGLLQLHRIRTAHARKTRAEATSKQPDSASAEVVAT